MAAFCIWETESYAAGDKLQVTVDRETVYVQSGGETEFTVKVENISGSEIRGVVPVSSSTYVSLIPGNEEADELDRFEFETEDAEYATWDGNEEGYTIAKGAVATFHMKATSGYEATGDYNDWIRFGNRHMEYAGGFWPIGYVVDEYYTGQCKVPVTVYNPQNAKLQFGTSSNYALSINEIAPENTINLGTINLGSNDPTASKTLYVKNSTDPKNAEEHGNSNAIKVDLNLTNADGYEWDTGCFTFSGLWGASRATLEPATSSKFDFVSGTVSVDASNYIEGTYTAYLNINTVPHGVRINNGAVKANGIYTWPVQVTLTGTNQKLPKAPTDLTVTPGNGQVKLKWKAGRNADEYTIYKVYRRNGTEKNASNINKASFNWSDYKEVGTGISRDNSEYSFVDGGVQNGNTYTYLVIGGEPYQGYPALTQAVKPLSSYAMKLMQPEDVMASEDVGGCFISWQMNDSYGGLNNDGSALVDHFNIYRDGVLAAQVDQNAVIATYEYNYQHEITDSEYEWEVFVSTPILYREYSWSVEPVSKSGVPGYMSEITYGAGYAEDTIMILGHTANYGINNELIDKEDYNSGYREVPRIAIRLQIADSNLAERIDYWRAEGTSAPDTSQAPYHTHQLPGFIVTDYLFEDTNIVPGRTYTYTVRSDSGDGIFSNYYTFTVKAGNASNSEFTSYSSPDVRMEMPDGRDVKLSWNVDNYDNDNKPIGSYVVHRYGKNAKDYTVDADGSFYLEFTDSPDEDGTYKYRVDMMINGVTVQGRELTFVRDTKPVDTDTLLKKPGTPQFDVRVSEGNPILRWLPSADGGEVEGYHIYRKDGGRFVIGEYTYDPHNSYQSPYTKYRTNNRYLTIDDPNSMSLTESGQYYQDDPEKGHLQSVYWDEDSCPHEYWITAYNSAGESEPSQVVELTYDVKPYNAPTSSDSFAPGQPIITKLWVDWEDDSGVNWDSYVGGELRVAFKDAATSGWNVDKWEVDFNDLNYNWGPQTLYAWQASKDAKAMNGTGKDSPTYSVLANNGTYGGDYGRTASVTVTAINSKGRATSEAATLEILSLPRFRATADNGSVLLAWTDLVNDNDTNVSSWEIWRKAEYGLWEKIKEFTPAQANAIKKTDNNNIRYYECRDNEVSNDWTYQYKVIAKCTDNKDRPSVVRKVKPTRTSASEAPGRPKNFTAKKVNGEIWFSWDKPDSGGNPQEYYIMYDDGSGGGWSSLTDVNAPSTSAVWSTPGPGTYTFFVYSSNYVNGQRLPYNGYGESIDDFPSASTVSDPVTITEADEDLQPVGSPGGFSLSAESSENMITLNWDESEGAGYYTIEREEYTDNEMIDTFGTVTVTADIRSYTDTTAIPGVVYRYLVYAHKGVSSTYQDIFVSARGRTKDQIVSERVSGLIAGLPDADSISATNVGEYENLINDVKQEYDKLTYRQKKLISDGDRAKLDACISKVEDIRLNEQYRTIVEPVQALIDALDDADQIGLDDETAVNEARAAYNSLPFEARKLVAAAKLIAAENRITELKKHDSDVALVDSLVTDLGGLTKAANITEANASAVLSFAEALQRRIDSLDADQKAVFDAADGINDLLRDLRDSTNTARAKLGLDHEHLIEAVEALAPNCSNAGHVAYFKCKACGKCFTDQEAVSEISEEETVIPIDETAHDWDNWTEKKKATCSEEGLQERVCRHNAEHKETLVIGRTKHEWNETPESESTEGGVTTQIYKCKHCDVTRTVTISVSGNSCGGHKWDWDDPIESQQATCTTAGFKRFRCKNAGCDNTVIEVQEIDPTAHSWGEWHDDPAVTCTTNGKRVRICQHDPNHKEEEIIEAQGHQWDAGKVTRKPSCNKAGEKTYTCTTCGATYTEPVDADPDIHLWNEWEVIDPPTCTSKGLKIRTCRNDASHYETAEIAMAAHSWDSGTVTIQPKVGVPGVRTYTCTICHATRTEAIAALAKPAPTEYLDLPAVKISKPKASKGKITVKWKALSKDKKFKKILKNVSGVQIEVATDAGFTNIVKTTTAGKKKASKVIKKLPKGKYYVRIRAYGPGRHYSVTWKKKPIKVR